MSQQRVESLEQPSVHSANQIKGGVWRKGSTRHQQQDGRQKEVDQGYHAEGEQLTANQIQMSDVYPRRSCEVFNVRIRQFPQQLCVDIELTISHSVCCVVKQTIAEHRYAEMRELCGSICNETVRY